MKTAILRVLGIAVVLSPAIGFAQKSKPTQAYYITKEEVDTVNAQPGVDRTIRVMDIGDQHFSVGIIHRGKTGAPAANAGGGAAAAGAAGAGRAAGAAGGAAAAGRQGGGAAAAAANTQPCGDRTGTSSGASGIAHDKQTEGYYIVSGSGEMVTGGHIINGRTSAPDSEVTTTLNGPSCSGQIGGEVVKRTVKVGDIIIIPAGVPHGWSNIPDHVDYLSFRPSSDILTVGYTHPSLKK
jgi:mannose-6-phosphate isomerase-like protein (cupin superfamily)